LIRKSVVAHFNSLRFLGVSAVNLFRGLFTAETPEDAEIAQRKAKHTTTENRMVART
jgi:hypothetical protein